jgi:hypothetical protein
MTRQLSLMISIWTILCRLLMQMIIRFYLIECKERIIEILHFIEVFISNIAYRLGKDCPDI